MVIQESKLPFPLISSAALLSASCSDLLATARPYRSHGPHNTNATLHLGPWYLSRAGSLVVVSQSESAQRMFACRSAAYTGVPPGQRPVSTNRRKTQPVLHWALPPLRNQMQATALQVQLVLKKWSFVLEVVFAVSGEESPSSSTVHPPRSGPSALRKMASACKVSRKLGLRGDHPGRSC